MRISLVMPSASPTGGAEEAFLQLLRSEAAKPLSCQAVFLEEGPLVDAVRPFTEESLVVQCGRTRQVHRWWRAAGEIATHAKRFDSDLVFGWMTKGHVYGGLAAWRAGLPAGWFQMGLPEKDLLGRMSRCLPARTVLACSDFVAEEQRAAQPSANVVSVPLGVDVSRFDPEKLPTPREARSQLGLPTEGPLIGIVGRLQRWKGMHTLIGAMPAVLEHHPDAHCVIVGGPYPAEPDYPDQLRRQVQELGIADKVTFAGAQQNVPLWMQAMDVFVHASEREPFGIVIVEALALGKPVIACKPGGPEQILDSAMSCNLVPYGAAQSLADALLPVLSDGPACLPDRVSLAKSFSAERYAERCVSNLSRIAV